MLDLLFVVVFAVVYPIAGFIGFRRLLKKMSQGMPLNRNHLYLNTVFWHWTLFVMLLILWASAGRTWSDLGVSLQPHWRFLIGAAIVTAVIVFLSAQLRQVVTGTEANLQRLKSEFGDLFLLVPRNGNELVRFNLLSVTAGIVEETLWRGFLIWYLGQFMPVWAAAIISAAGFAIAHAYQGPANLPRIALVGVILAGLYVLTGSLWLSIILHAAIDLLQGRLAYEVLRHSGTGNGDDTDLQTSA